jgi:hypothetical protein
VPADGAAEDLRRLVGVALRVAEHDGIGQGTGQRAALLGGLVVPLPRRDPDPVAARVDQAEPGEPGRVLPRSRAGDPREARHRQPPVPLAQPGGERVEETFRVRGDDQAGAVGVLGPEAVHAEVVQVDVLPAQCQVGVGPCLPVGDLEPERDGELGDLVDRRAGQQRDHAFAGHPGSQARLLD